MNLVLILILVCESINLILFSFVIRVCELVVPLFPVASSPLSYLEIAFFTTVLVMADNNVHGPKTKLN